jgi:hypothetical protein
MGFVIADIKRAAFVIRSDQRPITIGALAAELDTTPRKLGGFVSRVRGLKQDIGITSENKSQPYIQAMERLRDSGVMITPERVGFLTQRSARGFQTWMVHNSGKVGSFRVISRRECSCHRFIQRLRWCAKVRRARKLRVTATALADECGMERTAFHRFIRNRPELKKELGLRSLNKK